MNRRESVVALLASLFKLALAVRFLTPVGVYPRAAMTPQPTRLPELPAGCDW